MEIAPAMMTDTAVELGIADVGAVLARDVLSVWTIVVVVAAELVASIDCGTLRVVAFALRTVSPAV